MEVGNYVAVWFTAEAARQFLGLNATTLNRFCALGVMLRETPVGVWVDIDSINEQNVEDGKVHQEWTVQPKTCLIRWDYMTHMQVWATPDPPQDKRERIGFIRTT